MRRTARRRPSARRPPGGRRIALWLLVVIVAVPALAFAGYAAAARWLLSGPRLRAWINTSPQTTMLDWDEAVSRWPGTVRLKNLRIRGSDQNVEWIIRLSEARADYSVVALLSRTFQVSRVQGSGLSFRLRQKLDPKDPTNPPVDALPPIAGFSDPPLRASRDEPPAAPGNPWTVSIGGIAIEQFEEIWVDAYRFEGSARLHGRFFLRPGLRARVGPSDIDFEKGGLHVGTGRQPLMTELAGKIHAEFEEWDPRVVQGNAVWRSVIARIELHGPHPSLEFLNYYFRRSREPRFSGGPGVVSLSGAIDHGKASGRALLAARGATSHQSGVDLTGNVRVSLRIPAWNLEGSAMDVSGSSIQLSDVVAAGAEDTRGWWGRLDLSQAHANGGLLGKVRLECRDARPLLAVLGVGLPSWTRGLLTLEGLTANADVVLARTRTRVHELDAHGEKFHILGEYESRGDDERGAFLLETGLLRVGVKSADGHTGLHLFAPVHWYAREKELFAQTPDGDAKSTAKTR